MSCQPGTVSNGADRCLAQVCRTLISSYDVQEWWPARGRFEVMVGAVLVQNTRWVNVTLALRALRQARCLAPAALATVQADQLSGLIRPAGCQSVKARRLSSLATWVVRSGGVARLARRPTQELRGALLEVHGIGPETADAILCFAFQRPVFVADQYARRWLRRLGFAPASAVFDYETCRELVEGLSGWPRNGLQDLHAAIVLHAQAVCTGQPDCVRCPVNVYCNYF